MVARGNLEIEYGDRTSGAVVWRAVASTGINKAAAEMLASAGNAIALSAIALFAASAATSGSVSWRHVMRPLCSLARGPLIARVSVVR